MKQKISRPKSIYKSSGDAAFYRTVLALVCTGLSAAFLHVLSELFTIHPRISYGFILIEICIVLIIILYVLYWNFLGPGVKQALDERAERQKAVLETIYPEQTAQTMEILELVDKAHKMFRFRMMHLNDLRFKFDLLCADLEKSILRLSLADHKCRQTILNTGRTVEGKGEVRVVLPDDSYTEKGQSKNKLSKIKGTTERIEDLRTIISDIQIQLTELKDMLSEYLEEIKAIQGFRPDAAYFEDPYSDIERWMILAGHILERCADELSVFQQQEGRGEDGLTDFLDEI